MLSPSLQNITSNENTNLDARSHVARKPGLAGPRSALADQPVNHHRSKNKHDLKKVAQGQVQISTQEPYDYLHDMISKCEPAEETYDEFIFPRAQRFSQTDMKNILYTYMNNGTPDLNLESSNLDLEEVDLDVHYKMDALTVDLLNDSVDLPNLNLSFDQFY